MSQPSEQHKDPSLQFEVELRDDDGYEKEELGLPQDAAPAVPSICGLPLKYVSYVARVSRRDRASRSRALSNRLRTPGL